MVYLCRVQVAHEDDELGNTSNVSISGMTFRSTNTYGIKRYRNSCWQECDISLRAICANVWLAFFNKYNCSLDSYSHVCGMCPWSQDAAFCKIVVAFLTAIISKQCTRKLALNCFTWCDTIFSHFDSPISSFKHPFCFYFKWINNEAPACVWQRRQKMNLQRTSAAWH